MGTDRRDDRSDALRPTGNVRFDFARFDHSDEESMHGLVANIERTVPSRLFGVLVNYADIRDVGPVSERPPRRLSDVFEVSTIVLRMLSKHFSGQVAKKFKSNNVVKVASISRLVDEPAQVELRSTRMVDGHPEDAHG